jgi:thioesterase domain-containing protein
VTEPRPPGRELNVIERDLGVQWSDLLGRLPETIGASADFFELGGTDALLAELVPRIDDEFGAPVTVEQLAAAPTLERMAAVVKTTARKAYGHPAPPFQVAVGEPGNVPVFCVAAMGAMTLGWRRVGKHLDPRIPIYASESTAFDAEGRPLLRVEEIAAQHVERIRASVGRQPVVLCGHSFGGTVAYEIACQLERDGQDVAGLVLLDTAINVRIGREPWTFKRVPALLRETAKREIKAGRARAALLARRVGLMKVHDNESRVRWIIQSQRIANRKYRQKTFGGTLTLLTCEGFARDRDERLGWGQYVTGGIDVHEVVGEHRALLAPKWVQSTAALLDECLVRLSVPAAEPTERQPAARLG